MIAFACKRLIGSGVSFALLMLLTNGFFQGCAEEVVEKEHIRPVTAMKVGDIEGFTGRLFPGRAQATEEVNLGFEVGGTLIERPVDKGDEVKREQLLARLDPRDFQNELKAAKAERDRAEAYRERIAEALKARAVAKQDLTDAEARLKEANAAVNIKRKALEDSKILAPFDGVVAATYVENFQRVQPKEKVLRLLDLSKVEFTIDVPETLISSVQYVSEIWIVFDAFSDRKIPATVKEVGTEASETTRTYPVTLIMDQPEDIKILPGMAGKSGANKVKRPENLSEAGIVVPISALYSPEESQKTYLWIIDEETRTVQQREVTPGRFSEQGMIIKGSLQPGEWVVTAGVNFLREGQKVRILGETSQEVSP